MKKLIVIPIMFMLCGCFSTKNVNINTVKPWERRYTPSDTILVNGDKIDSEGDVIWIISGKTFYNILTQCVDGNVDQTNVKTEK